MNAVEELLRFDSPVQVSGRQATVDLIVAGVTIERGDNIGLMIGAANRDKRRWHDADELRLDRPDPKPISFGFGAHHCLGAALARMELRLALPALLDVLGDYTDRPRANDWKRSFACAAPPCSRCSPGLPPALPDGGGSTPRAAIDQLGSRDVHGRGRPLAVPLPDGKQRWTVGGPAASSDRAASGRSEPPTGRRVGHQPGGGRRSHGELRQRRTRAAGAVPARLGARSRVVPAGAAPADGAGVQRDRPVAARASGTATSCRCLQRTLVGYAGWVERFLQAIGADEPVVVLGHSFGGGIATRFAHDRPERVRYLVMLNAVGDAQSFAAARTGGAGGADRPGRRAVVARRAATDGRSGDDRPDAADPAGQPATDIRSPCCRPRRPRSPPTCARRWRCSPLAGSPC